MTLKRKGLKRTGPLPGPFQPSRLKYKCPVFECKSAKIRGDRMKLVLRVNLGPLNELKGLINEVLASDPDRSYLRKEDRISQLPSSKDVHKSAAIVTFQTNNENKSCFPKYFWFEN